MQHMTNATKLGDIKRAWHLIDVKGKTLGRVSTEIAKLLTGKAKPYFVRHLDCGDFVVVINAKDIAVTGKKEDKKMYYRHSGYPGGFKAESLRDLRERKPEEILQHAVRGMLPQTRLRDRMLQRLKVFAGPEHDYKDKLQVAKE